mgnify:CR=1 FL=1
MRISEQTSQKNIYLLRLLVLALIGVTIYALDIMNNSKIIYTDIAKSAANQPTVAQEAKLGENTIAIPNYELFKTGNVWALISKKHPLTGEAGYDLIDIPVAHGDSDSPMKIARNISDGLERLVNAAEADGEPLMVSSAYRSLQEQEELYDEFVAKNGREMAALYVSPVGSSEHHTGLSVDFSSVSNDCSEDSDSCSLSQTAAAWLANNAHRFGFIQRYPQGKQDITGVGYEPWHYRFVGVPLATAMIDSDMTFEEVVTEIAPGYALPR